MFDINEMLFINFLQFSINQPSKVFAKNFEFYVILSDFYTLNKQTKT